MISAVPRTPLICSVRTAIYTAQHLEPTLSEYELSQPLSEEDPRNFHPIKAAHNEHSLTSTYDPELEKFICIFVYDGKKAHARKLMANAYAKIKETQLTKYRNLKTDEERSACDLNPQVIFNKAVYNCKPLLATQKVVRGGTVYTVPIPISENYARFKAMNWINDSAFSTYRAQSTESRMVGKKIPMFHFMAAEMIDASEQQGKSIRKKQEFHRLCEANRAYASYRW